MHMVHKIIFHIRFWFDQLAPFRSVIPSCLGVRPSNLWFRFLFAGSNFYFWWCFGALSHCLHHESFSIYFGGNGSFFLSGDRCCDVTGLIDPSQKDIHLLAY